MKFSGNNEEDSVAFRNRENTVIDEMVLYNAFVGLIHYPNASLDLGKLISNKIGGDNVNLRGGDVIIDNLVIRGAKPWKSYRQYHQDCVQSYPVMSNGYTVNNRGTISNVIIKNIDIEVTGFEHQVFMLSNGHFNKWYIGEESIRIRCDYPYWMVANTMSNSVIGNVDGNVDIEFNRTNFKNWKKPIVRIGDGIKGSSNYLKSSPHRTKNVTLLGCGNLNDVPKNVEQF